MHYRLVSNRPGGVDPSPGVVVIPKIASGQSLGPERVRSEGFTCSVFTHPHSDSTHDLSTPNRIR